MGDGFGDAPLDHLLRAMPPWWTGTAVTECGRPAADVKSVVERSAMKAKFDRLGKQRAAFSTCMTCAGLYSRAQSWEARPADVLARAIEGMRWREVGDQGDSAAQRMRRELLALGVLVEEHREEFEGLVAALEQTGDLDQARRRSRMRAVR
jgi:hypothetical protein